MGVEPRHTRVEYDYIAAHRRFWENDVAPQLARIMRSTREMEVRCRNTLLFGGFVEASNEMVDFIQNRADEGHRTQFDFAQRLAEIKAWYETSQRLHSHLMQTGGLQP
jgi:hypothetical protein